MYDERSRSTLRGRANERLVERNVPSLRSNVIRRAALAISPAPVATHLGSKLLTLSLEQRFRERLAYSGKISISTVCLRKRKGRLLAWGSRLFRYGCTGMAVLVTCMAGYMHGWLHAGLAFWNAGEDICKQSCTDAECRIRGCHARCKVAPVGLAVTSSYNSQGGSFLPIRQCFASTLCLNTHGSTIQLKSSYNF